jgi:hemoglobin/transferrin/lactoferrin receptor protein
VVVWSECRLRRPFAPSVDFDQAIGSGGMIAIKSDSAATANTFPQSKRASDVNLRPLAILIATALSTNAAAVTAEVDADAGSALAATALDAVYVIARKLPQAQAEVVNAVGQVDRETLDRIQAQDIRDAFRYEPAVAVPADGHRFGLSGFNIRGLDGNRVAIEVDGVPLAEGFRVGDLANAGRDAVDVEALSRIEFLRGPASTLYGSDALAGVVAYTTRDPHELARDGGYFGYRYGYSSRDDGHRNSALAAWSGGAHGVLALVTERRFGEVENNPVSGPDANPSERERRSGLFKYVFRGDDYRAALLLDRSILETDTDVLSLVRGPGRFSTTQALRALDSGERERAMLSAEGTPDLGWLERWQARLYRQDSHTRQRSLQSIAAVPPRTPAYFRDRVFVIDQQQTGGELTLHSRFDHGWLAHDLVYGVSVQRNSIEQFRNGLQTRLDTGQVSNVILGEVMPVRDFPNSQTTQTGVYLQDDIALGDSGLSVIAGLRHERYRLDARSDPMFAEDFDIVPADIQRSRTTPRLGLRWETTPGLSVYALAAEGYRAPPFSDVNIALSLMLLNYEVRPNPDLRPERSRGYELGLDWQGDFGGVRAALFDNRYRDLIESRANLGIDPDTGALVFQSVNRERARIQGLEMAFDYRLHGLFDVLEGFSLNGALAWMRGDDTRRDQPLNSVPPPRAVLGLRRQAQGRLPGMELVMTASKARDRIDATGPALFRAPGYATLDLLADWRLNPHAKLTAGVFNLADRRYWDWGQLSGVLENNVPSADFFTAPGRNFGVTLELAW